MLTKKVEIDSLDKAEFIEIIKNEIKNALSINQATSIEKVGEEFIETAELLKRLKISKSYLQTKIESGEIPVRRLPNGRKLFFVWSEVIDAINGTLIHKKMTGRVRHQNSQSNGKN